MAVEHYYGGDNAHSHAESDEDMDDFPSPAPPSAPVGGSTSSSGTKATGAPRYLIQSSTFRDVAL